MPGESSGRESGGEPQGGNGRTHRFAISRRLAAAASILAVLLAACEDLTLPGGTFTTADLLLLPLNSSAPSPAGTSFYVVNSRTTTRALRHSDGFNTLFVEIQFPSGSLESQDGTPLGLGDSVLVSLTADAGAYGIHLAPEGLHFAALGRPALTFAYVKYGDLTVADGSRYADAVAYANALGVWRETSVDRWTKVGAAGTAGEDVRASLSQAGHFTVAAPR